jgi:hypothetical protein
MSDSRKAAENKARARIIDVRVEARASFGGEFVSLAKALLDRSRAGRIS